MSEYRDEWTLFEERVRAIILKGLEGESLRDLEKKTGVARQSVAKFLARENGLNSWSLGKILGYLKFDCLICMPDYLLASDAAASTSGMSGGIVFQTPRIENAAEPGDGRKSPKRRLARYEPYRVLKPSAKDEKQAQVVGGTSADSAEVVDPPSTTATQERPDESEVGIKGRTRKGAKQ